MVKIKLPADVEIHIATKKDPLHFKWIMFVGEKGGVHIFIRPRPSIILSVLKHHYFIGDIATWKTRLL
jgi:hypothetical protein